MDEQVSEKFEQSLRKINAPCKVIFTLKKLKTCLSSLKLTVEKSFISDIVYKIKCPLRSSCYVSQTSRHLIYCIKEHRRNGPVASHFMGFNFELTMDSVTIPCWSNKSESHLMILEALMTNETKPTLNTKDEYCSRSLVIKI